MNESPARITSLARPTRLYTPPHPVSVEPAQGSQPPRRFRWRGEMHDVVLCFGPERIEAPWWGISPFGDRLPTRDYFRVSDQSGRWLWLGRDEEGRWFVHGDWT